MRNVLVVAALVVGLGAGVVDAKATTLPAGVEGCIASSPGANVDSAPAGSGNALNNAKCSYKATRKGGYVAAADNWTITRWKVVSGQKRLVARYSGTRTAGGPHCNTSVILPGELVEVTVTYGAVAVGAPAPKDTDPYAPAGTACPKFPV